MRESSQTFGREGEGSSSVGNNQIKKKNVGFMLLAYVAMNASSLLPSRLGCVGQEDLSVLYLSWLSPEIWFLGQAVPLE